MTQFALQAQPARFADEPILSSFEFWPDWLFYAPVVLHWLALGIRYGDLTLPTAANPSFELGGLCGESKGQILDLAEPAARDWIAPYAMLTAGQDDPAPLLAAQPLGWPLVVKPDIGCNGTGVRLVQDMAGLHAAIAAFPPGVRLMLQAFSPHPGEAGIFYIRHPDEPAGRITSLTLKSSPVVVGDGRRDLRSLVMAHPRAGRVPQLYLPRLAERLAEIPRSGQIVPLVFTGNHCKGSVFHDGAASITPALTAQVDAIARAIPGFHFGRIDVRYASLAALQAGRSFTVIEVNGTGSEATHIWDPRCTLRHAYASQFQHYRAAWTIAHTLRQRGARPSGIRNLWQAWRRQVHLMRSYPLND
jgi:hypothetical protein